MLGNQPHETQICSDNSLSHQNNDACDWKNIFSNLEIFYFYNSNAEIDRSRCVDSPRYPKYLPTPKISKIRAFQDLLHIYV